jgi:hypothetical protein
MRTLSRLLLWIGVCVLLGETVGCQYYEEFRVKMSTADLKEAQAALLHDYRLCMEKYQDDPPRQRNSVAPIPSGSERLKLRASQANRTGS